MNTKNIYIAKLGLIKYKDFVEPGENMLYFYDTGKYVLVKENKYNGKYTDLLSRKKYEMRTYNINLDEAFLIPNTFETFNSYTGNEKKHLSKTKIISLYRSKRR